MTTNNKGRNGGDRATPKTSDNRDYTKSSRINHKEIQAPKQGAALTKKEATGVTPEAANLIPDVTERPDFCDFDDWLKHDGAKLRPGVWHLGIKENRGEPILRQTWVCSPLHVEAVTFDRLDHPTPEA